MFINESLIYTEENFNIVFDNNCVIDQAAKIIRSVLSASSASENAKNLKTDKENRKIYIYSGTIGSFDTVVIDICQALASAFEDGSFYGHAYYFDSVCDYASCADYRFENGKLYLELIESENGNGICPECGQQIVCFDAFDASKTYHCDACDKDVSAEELFDGVLPVKKQLKQNMNSVLSVKKQLKQNMNRMRKNINSALRSR